MHVSVYGRKISDARKHAVSRLFYLYYRLTDNYRLGNIIRYVGEDKIVYDNISTSEARRAFLAGFGWEIDEEQTEEDAVVIPAKFDTVYEDYNEIQKAQGLDLERYRGKTVMRYTYPVKNYPDYDGTVYATLLIYKDRVIGGDVCSASVDGFAHGWRAP